MDKRLEQLDSSQTSWGVKLYLLSKIFIRGIFGLLMFSGLIYLLADMLTKKTMPHGTYLFFVLIGFFIFQPKETMAFFKDIVTGKCSDPIDTQSTASAS